MGMFSFSTPVIKRLRHLSEKADDIELKDYLSLISPSSDYDDEKEESYELFDLLATRETDGSTLLHVAAKSGKIKLFYSILRCTKTDTLEKYLNKTFFFDKNCQTPWHYAAANGHADFFKAPENETDLKIWKLLKKNWLNSLDKDHHMPIHKAVLYSKADKAETIRKKKHTVSNLLQLEELNLWDCDEEKKTILHMAAEAGCYETAKEIIKSQQNNVTQTSISIQSSEVKKSSEKNAEKRTEFNLKDNNGFTPLRYATNLGHQRIKNAILFYNNPKTTKNKLDQDNMMDEDSIKDIAVDVNNSEESFLKDLKLINDPIQAKKLISLRLESLQKEFRKKSLITTLLGTFCPALTMAAFIATFGGLNPEPLSAALLTVIVLPVFYVPLAYFCYKSRLREFNNVVGEKLYLSWLSAKLSAYENNFNKKLEGLLQQAEALKLKMDETKDPEKLDSLKKSYQSLRTDYQTLQKQMKEVVEFPTNKKPKLALKYLSRKEMRNKKNLGLYDDKEGEKWVNPVESRQAFANYTASIFCPVGATFTVCSTITTLVLGKFGLGFLGLTAAGFLGGPIGIAAVAVVATLALTVAVGVALYKSSYQRDKKDMGQSNRDLVLLNDDCKRRASFTKTKEIQKQLNQKMHEIDTGIQTKPTLSIAKDNLPMQPFNSIKKQFILPIKEGIFSNKNDKEGVFSNKNDFIKKNMPSNFKRITNNNH